MNIQRGNARLRHWGAIGVVLMAGLAAGCQKRSNIGQAAVDADRLVNAESEPGSWMSHGRTYSEQRFSTLDAINTDTVGRLGLAWYADLDSNRGQEATPLMVDGALYVSTAWSKVRAYDAKNGKLLWTYDRSEEHTSELQSRENLVCRLLLEKKKIQKQAYDHI